MPRTQTAAVTLALFFPNLEEAKPSQQIGFVEEATDRK